MRNTKLRPVALLVSLLTVATLSTLAPAAYAAGTQGPFKASLDKIMAAEGAPPGISVLITRNGKSTHYSRGIADTATGARPARNLHFRTASVAKAFSGGVALSLVAQRKLKLNDTVGELLPGLLPKANRVTLAQLLHHTSGLAEYIASKGFVKALQTDPHQYMTPRKLTSFVKKAKLGFKPGSEYEYSDTDNIVVGLMAEKVTGIPYSRLLKRQVYNRVGLRNTSLPKTVNMPKPFLHGYFLADPLEDETKVLNPALAWASGGMVSTLPDLGRYFRSYVPGTLFGNRIRKAQRSWVKGNSSPPGPGQNSAGLALFRYRTKCGTMYGHTGSFPGYRVFVAASGNGQRSISYVVNAQITPDQGSAAVSALIRQSQVAAVCHAMG